MMQQIGFSEEMRIQMLYYQLLLSDFFFLLALYSGCIGIIQFYKLVALFI